MFYPVCVIVITVYPGHLIVDKYFFTSFCEALINDGHDRHIRLTTQTVLMVYRYKQGWGFDRSRHNVVNG